MQFQRFLGTSKTDRGKLRASFRGGTVAPGRRGACPPARSPHASLRLGVIDLEARPGPAGPAPASTHHTPAHLHTRTPAHPHGSPQMSHVIPRHVFQTLKSGRCNSNVFRTYRKLTEGNYVRVFREERLPRPTRDPPALPAADPLFLPPAREIAAHPHGSPQMSHVIPQTILQTLKSGRCNSNIFSAHQKLTEGNYVRLLEESTCQRTRVSCLPASRGLPTSRGRPEPGARPSDNPGTLAAQTAYGVRIDNTGSGILVA